MRTVLWCPCFFFFNDTATTEIYTLSLHDALPISQACQTALSPGATRPRRRFTYPGQAMPSHPRSPLAHGLCKTADRKSTRLNSSHGYISYAVFCLKKKNDTLVLAPLCSSHRHHLG